MITEDKVIEIFCIMDEFCKNFASECEKNLLLCDKEHHYRFVELMPCMFPHNALHEDTRLWQVQRHKFRGLHDDTHVPQPAPLCQHGIQRCGCGQKGNYGMVSRLTPFSKTSRRHWRYMWKNHLNLHFF